MPESTTPVSEQETARLSGGGSGAGQLLQHRLDLIEDLWKSVLRSECPPEQSERLLRLKQLSDPVSLDCLLYTSPSPRDYAASRMPSSA